MGIGSLVTARADSAASAKTDTVPVVRARMSRAHALRVARHIARVLKEHGATKVLLFGSLVRGEGFDPGRSDIDIYHEGIPAERVIHAEVMSTWETGEEDEYGLRRVDLVWAGLKGLKIRKQILAEGIPIP
jgi:predicted nucleotidyltransferase